MVKMKKMILVFITSIFCFLVLSCNSLNDVKKSSIASIENYYENIKKQNFIYTDFVIEYEITQTKNIINNLKDERLIEEEEMNAKARIDNLCLTLEEFNRIKDVFITNEISKGNQSRADYFTNNFTIKAMLGKYDGKYAIVIDNVMYSSNYKELPDYLFKTYNCFFLQSDETDKMFYTMECIPEYLTIFYSDTNKVSELQIGSYLSTKLSYQDMTKVFNYYVLMYKN